MPTLAKITNRIILLSYFALAAVTPLIFSTYNTELFEVPKMHFVYLMAVIIFFATILKQIASGKISIPKNLPVLAFLIFLTFQTLSTTSSIDKFTSVFGYPSRLNGGILSQIAYFAIFACALINLSAIQAKKILITVVLAALFVSLWGIPAYFGYDPSCFVLTHKLTSTCWQADFDPTVRIFSTLGQPNWLASYLVLILPIAVAFALDFKKIQPKIFFSTASVILLIALVLTNSRAGIIGLGASVLIFLILLGTKFIRKNLKLVSVFLAGTLAVILIFGSFLLQRILEVVNQPELGKVPKGTESGQIRLIVWKGTIDVFREKPLLGWGPETFAYSYYLHRPLEHNKTTEWNFFYNKAHNELLNYLANIGLLGAFSYLSLVGIITYQIIRKKNDIISKSILAGFWGYQLTILFGFSTVATQTISFFILASALILEKLKSINIEIKNKFQFPLILTALLLLIFTISYPVRSFFGDALYERAKNIKSTTRSVSAFEAASVIFPAKNPFILSDYSYSLAIQAAASEEDWGSIAKEVDRVAKQALDLAPNNLIVARKIANTYILIADFDQTYKESALTIGNKIVELAPTDPQSYLTFAKIQSILDLKDEAEKSLQKSLQLKPDYIEAQELLEQLNDKELQ